MPYKSETAHDELERKESSEDPHHPAQGAGLLLSLSSNKRSSLEEGDKASKSSTMNPITPMDGFGAEGAPVVAGVSGSHNHRLYHSPIKLNKDPASSKADHHGSRSSWSPYHPTHQGLGGRAYYPPPPPYAPFPSEEALDRRQVSDERGESPPMQARSSETHAEEKKDDDVDEEDEEEEEAGQTVISPASSNEKWEDEAESSPEEARSSAAPSHHHPHWPHPGMYPPWQGQAPPGFPPHHPGSMPPYPPHYAAAAAAAAGYPYPPPWYHGAPYPPYGMPPPGVTTETTPTMEMSSAAAEPKPDDYDWHYVGSASLNRCVPLKHPPPNRFWGYVLPSHV